MKKEEIARLLNLSLEEVENYISKWSYSCWKTMAGYPTRSIDIFFSFLVLKSYIVPLPPIKEQERIVKTIESVFHEIKG